MVSVLFFVCGFKFASGAAVLQDCILVLSRAACHLCCLGVSVGNWLEINLRPPASPVRGVAAQQRVRHKDRTGLLQAGGGLGLLKLLLTGFSPNVSSGKYTRLYLEEFRCSALFHCSQNTTNRSCTDSNKGWVNCAAEPGCFINHWEHAVCQTALFNTAQRIPFLRVGLLFLWRLFVIYIPNTFACKYFYIKSIIECRYLHVKTYFHNTLSLPTNLASLSSSNLRKHPSSVPVWGMVFLSVLLRLILCMKIQVSALLLLIQFCLCLQTLIGFFNEVLGIAFY